MASTIKVTGGSIIRPYFLSGGGRANIKTFPEGASQTFVPGEVLIQDTTGGTTGQRVKVAANDPTTGIIGIAVSGATGTTGNWTGMGSRTDITVLTAGDAGILGPGVAGILGQGIGGTYQNVGNVATLTGNGGTKGLVQVYLAGTNSLFVAHVLDTQVISSADIGVQFGLEKDATNLIWRIDRLDTANKVVQVVDLFDADGDTNGRLIFKFVAATNLLYGER